jgi:hypothetical protein
MKAIIFDGIMKISKMPELEIKDVLKAYSGEPGMCMCGCSGNYSYPKLRQEDGGKDRGYNVGDAEVNDKRIKTIFNHFYKNDGIEIEVIMSDHKGIEYIFTKIIGKTQYTLYVK